MKILNEDKLKPTRGSRMDETEKSVEAVNKRIVRILIISKYH